MDEQIAKIESKNGRKTPKPELRMQTTRRQFIQSGLGFAFAMTLNPTLSASEAKTIPIGLTR
jgi:hypothetical protein